MSEARAVLSPRGQEIEDWLKNSGRPHMDEVDDNSWIETRESEIDAKWNAILPEIEMEITEDDLPF